jgi:hypothetical protein
MPDVCNMPPSRRGAVLAIVLVSYRMIVLDISIVITGFPIGKNIMRIGILGSGLMGGKLGTIFARARHDVIFSYARSDPLRPLTAFAADGECSAQKFASLMLAGCRACAQTESGMTKG